MEMPLRILLEYAGVLWPDQVHRALQNTAQNSVVTFLRQFLISEGTTSQFYKDWHQWVSNTVNFISKLTVTRIGKHDYGSALAAAAGAYGDNETIVRLCSIAVRI